MALKNQYCMCLYPVSLPYSCKALICPMHFFLNIFVGSYACIHASQRIEQHTCEPGCHWTARYVTWLLNNLTPQGIGFSFLCFQAARAYDAAAIVIRGPTARTNFTYPLQLLHLKTKRGRVRPLQKENKREEKKRKAERRKEKKRKEIHTCTTGSLVMWQMSG